MGIELERMQSQLAPGKQILISKIKNYNFRRLGFFPLLIKYFGYLENNESKKIF